MLQLAYDRPHRRPIKCLEYLHRPLIGFPAWTFCLWPDWTLAMVVLAGTFLDEI